MVVASVDIVIFSLDPYSLLVEVDIILNKLFGIVDWSVQWSESCWIFLWFLNNLMVKIVAQLIRVYNWLSCVLADIRSAIPRQLMMLLV